MPILYAGAAKVDITPLPGTLVNGDFIPHYAHTIHDPLYAKALVLRQEATTLAIVIADICAMPKDLLDQVKEVIARETGIPPAQALIASTHTHFAGSVTDIYLSGADHAYRQQLPALVVQCVRDALAALRPAQLAGGSVQAPEHVVCRRYFMKEGFVTRNPVTGHEEQVKTNPVGQEQYIRARAGEPDPELGYLAVRGVDGRWIALLGNYSMHYVGDCEPGGITADYFGVFSRQLQQALQAGDDFTGMLSNGTSGDANIWDFMLPGRYPDALFAKSALIGSQLAEKVAQSLAAAEWQDAPGLSARYTEIPLRTRKPSPAVLQAAAGIMGVSGFHCLQADEEGLRRIYAREQLLLQAYPDTVQFPLQLLRMGNCAIGALGGEFFSETGLWLKKNNPGGRYFTISMANGYVGYVPPAHEFEKGGYETWHSRLCCMELEAENKIRQAMLALMRQ